jgi:hypothetical protein
MRLPFRKSEVDKRAATARADLDAARAQLTAVDAEENVALTDGAAFQAWRTKREAIVTEVERLDRLVTALQAGAEAARAHDEAEALRKRLADARKKADDLAGRVRKDGPRIASELLQLARDAAQQALEAKVLNANLPEGEAPIPVADILARDFGTEPRQDIASRAVELWVAESTGIVIGDQDAVVSEDGVRGQVHVSGGTMRWRCIRRSFRETEYHPRTLSDWPGSFHQLLRLPRLDGPGVLFDGAYVTTEAAAALDIAAAVKPAQRQPRPTQIELVPVDPIWPPKVDGDVAA